MKYVLYFCISTFRIKYSVPNMAVFFISLIYCFPDMLPRYFLSDFEMGPFARLITGITFLPHPTCLLLLLLLLSLSLLRSVGKLSDYLAYKKNLTRRKLLRQRDNVPPQKTRVAALPFFPHSTRTRIEIWGNASPVQKT